MRARHRNERGVVGGAEGVAVGVLVLVAGSLLVLNAWAVVDTRTALDAAAREYLRAYTEGSDPTEAEAAGGAALLDVVHGRGRTPAELTVDEPDASRFGPCAAAVVTVSAIVPAVRLPFVDGLGERRVDVRHVELIDAHREVVPGSAYAPEETPCAQ